MRKGLPNERPAPLDRPVACSRMYDVTRSVRGHWHRLFRRVGERAGIALRIVDHAAPRPLDALWDRPDLGCVFMCGYSFMTRADRMKPVAVPVPSLPRYGGRPAYVSDLLVAAGSPLRTADELAGQRLAWMVRHSYSGYHAPRHFLAGISNLIQPPEPAGPLVTPCRALEAVLQGEADATAVDGYLFDLIGRHQPDLAAQFRVIASTPSAPMPLLVASPALGQDACNALSRAFFDLHTDTDCRPAMEALLLDRFCAADIQSYDLLTARRREADAVLPEW